MRDCTFLLTCVPTEGCLNCCVPIFFGAVGLRAGAILCVPCFAGLAFSLWVVIADRIFACCSGLRELKVCDVNLRPENAFWSRKSWLLPGCKRHVCQSEID